MSRPKLERYRRIPARKNAKAAMSPKKVTVLVLAGALVAALAWQVLVVMIGPDQSQPSLFSDEATIIPDRLVRPHSPILGPSQAPVTIVEFFDPACETCRDFHPRVKDLLQKYPQEVRLVLRYATFHPDSEKAVRLLEASKKQDRYWQVMEALLNTQPLWANHRRPSIEIAYQSAQQAGLDMETALREGATHEIDAIIQQDRQDVVDLRIVRVPTFFVNGKRLTTFGARRLSNLAAREVAQVKEAEGSTTTNRE